MMLCLMGRELHAAGREKRRLYASLGAMTGLAVSILLM